jgi:hypothetical protein
MLSQDDRRQLEVIANHLELADLQFATALSEVQPRRSRGDRRWPFMLAAVVPGLVVVAGLVAQAVVVILLGAAALGCSMLGYWLHVHRAQGSPRRMRRRSV